MRVVEAQPLEAGAAADHKLSPRQVEGEESLDVLFDRYAADIEEDRLGMRKLGPMHGTEEIGVDALGPDGGVAETAPLQQLLQVWRADEAPGGGGVKPAHVAVGPAKRHRQPGPEIFGKLRVVCRRERQPAPQAIAAREIAERPFGGDMDGLGTKRLD